MICHFNASWCTRVRRDDLLTVQVDGTAGSAVAGLRDVWIQPYGATPRPVWNPDIPQAVDFHAGWQKLPEQQETAATGLQPGRYGKGKRRYRRPEPAPCFP